MNTLRLALLEPDDHLRTQYAHQLTRNGLSVHACQDRGSLYQLLDRYASASLDMADARTVVLLRAQAFPPALLEELLPQLQNNYPVIVIAEGTEDSAGRVRLLERGADACTSAVSDASEIVALVRAQARLVAKATGQSHARAKVSGMVGPAASSHARGTHGYPFDDERSSHSRSGGHPTEERLTSGDIPNGVEERHSASTAHVASTTTHGGFAGASGDGAVGYGVSAADMSAYESRVSAAGGPMGVRDATPLTAYAAQPGVSSDTYGLWTLAFQDWILVNPHGVHVSLTGVERQFFSALMLSDRRELPRSRIEDAAPDFAFKSISVVVSRMRKKVNRFGCALPLHTVHGMGYVFIGTLVRQPAA